MSAEAVEPITCELNRVFPCLEKRPQPAVAMARFEDCDCDEDHPSYRAIFPICAPCLKWVVDPAQATCGAGWRRFRKETRYVHQRSEGLTKRRNGGSRYQTGRAA